MLGNSGRKSEFAWLKSHWATPKYWDFLKQKGSLLNLPIPETTEDSDLNFRSDIPLAEGSKKTRNSQWASFANWINDLYLPSSYAPLDCSQIAKWIRLEHAGNASVKDLLSTIKCRSRQLALIDESASDFYLASVLTKRITKAYGCDKGVSKAPAISRSMIQTIQENRLFKILDLWLNSALRVSGWLSLDYKSIPALDTLRKRYSRGQRFMEIRVHKDKTSTYIHLVPIFPWIRALGGIPLSLPVVERDLQEIKPVFTRYKYDYKEHSPRRTWCLWVRRRLNDRLKLATKAKISSTIFLERINELVGWAKKSTEFFNYSSDFQSFRESDLPEFAEDIWNFIRFGNTVPNL